MVLLDIGFYHSTNFRCVLNALLARSARVGVEFQNSQSLRHDVQAMTMVQKDRLKRLRFTVCIPDKSPMMASISKQLSREAKLSPPSRVPAKGSEFGSLQDI